MCVCVCGVGITSDSVRSSGDCLDCDGAAPYIKGGAGTSSTQVQLTTSNSSPSISSSSTSNWRSRNTRQ